MRNRTRSIMLVAAVMVVGAVCAPSHAAWVGTVAQDGSGDFTTIGDAIADIISSNGEYPTITILDSATYAEGDLAIQHRYTYGRLKIVGDEGQRPTIDGSGGAYALTAGTMDPGKLWMINLNVIAGSSGAVNLGTTYTVQAENVVIYTEGGTGIEGGDYDDWTKTYSITDSTFIGDGGTGIGIKAAYHSGTWTVADSTFVDLAVGEYAGAYTTLNSSTNILHNNGVGLQVHDVGDGDGDIVSSGDNFYGNANDIMDSAGTVDDLGNNGGISGKTVLDYDASPYAAWDGDACGTYNVDPSLMTVGDLGNWEELGLIPGDANGDGEVGIADLSALADNYGITSGATWAQGDFNNDGEVGIADLSALADNYGRTSGNQSVPEPATLSVLAMAGLGLLKGRSRR